MNHHASTHVAAKQAEEHRGPTFRRRVLDKEEVAGQVGEAGAKRAERVRWRLKERAMIMPCEMVSMMMVMMVLV